MNPYQFSLSDQKREKAEIIITELCGLLFGDRRYRPPVGTARYILMRDMIPRYVAIHGQEPVSVIEVYRSLDSLR